jgi:hypothetical protein
LGCAIGCVLIFRKKRIGAPRGGSPSHEFGITARDFVPNLAPPRPQRPPPSRLSCPSCSESGRCGSLPHDFSDLYFGLGLPFLAATIGRVALPAVRRATGASPATNILHGMRAYSPPLPSCCAKSNTQTTKRQLNVWRLYFGSYHDFDQGCGVTRCGEF